MIFLSIRFCSILALLLILAPVKLAYSQTTQEQALIETQKTVALINYVQKNTYLQKVADQAFAEISQGIIVAQKSNNNQLREMLNKRNEEIFDAVMEELKNFDVPEELVSYHMKIIDVYTFRKLANEALLNNNVESSRKLFYQSAMSHIRALDEFKVILMAHNVPDDVIRGIEETILKERQSLRESGLSGR
ncbi:MAG TPA: hypothetical protein PL155_07300 [Candidatus Omnitrophota bacterium]|nr:hypothetical protein [Candidatus Omnitrophota bacterium]HPD85361.1 hypothetical protein [Candidatus Omnitrophota bacterium]HRZ04138.1 hypothetical protein [Candidatus Omnitrophota bacterium]